MDVCLCYKTLSGEPVCVCLGVCVGVRVCVLVCSGGCVGVSVSVFCESARVLLQGLKGENTKPIKASIFGNLFS